jgi:hypothetical protein
MTVAEIVQLLTTEAERQEKLGRFDSSAVLRAMVKKIEEGTGAAGRGSV